MGFKRTLNKNIKNIRDNEIKKMLETLKENVKNNGKQYNFRNVEQFIEHTIKTNNKDLIGECFSFSLSDQKDMDEIVKAIKESQNDKNSLAWILYNEYMIDETGKRIKINGEYVVNCCVECVGEFVE